MAGAQQPLQTTILREGSLGIVTQIGVARQAGHHVLEGVAGEDAVLLGQLGPAGQLGVGDGGPEESGEG